MNKFAKYEYGLNPILYAQNLYNKLDLPIPVDENKILEHLRLKLNKFDGSEQPEIRKELQEACSWLKRDLNGKGIIYLNMDVSPTRRRLSIFHECGHFVLPWHKEINHFCTEHDVDGISHKEREKEAFLFASELMFPAKYFSSDLKTLPLSIQTVESLRRKYDGSLEATAITYVERNPKACALVVSEINNNENKNDYPLITKYFVPSKPFSKNIKRYVKPKTNISKDNLIYKAFKNKQLTCGEIPAKELGSSKSWVYCSENLSFNSDDSVLSLVWFEDTEKQLELNL